MQDHPKAKRFLQLLLPVTLQSAVWAGISPVTAPSCKPRAHSNLVLKSLPQSNCFSLLVLTFSRQPPNINSREWLSPKGGWKATNKCPFAVCRAEWCFPRRSFSSSTGTQLIAPVSYNKASPLIWRAALGPLQCPILSGHNGVWGREGAQPECSAVWRPHPISHNSSL